MRPVTSWLEYLVLIVFWAWIKAFIYQKKEFVITLTESVVVQMRSLYQIKPSDGVPLLSTMPIRALCLSPLFPICRSVNPLEGVRMRILPCRGVWSMFLACRANVICSPGSPTGI